MSNQPVPPVPSSASFPSAPVRPALLAGAQLALWGAYGIAYYITLQPHQPFADLLWKQTAIAAGSGLLLSTALAGLYGAAGLHRRRPAGQLLMVVGGGLGAGLLWHQVKGWGVDAVNPFIAPVMATTALRPGEGSLLSGGAAFPVVMLAWSGLYAGLVHWTEQQKQERRRLQADAEAQRARLRMLRYQLNPHFFFNALNTIGALAGENPQRVKEAVHELSGFLRYTLLDDDTLQAPLRDEVQAAEHYLAVEKIRFESDLQVEVDVSAEAGQAPVPAFLVLPLVENAVKHGQRTSPPPLRIQIAAHRSPEALTIDVANTGHWRDDRPGPSSTETGLDNVCTRLRTEYPDQHAFDILERDGWVRARIRIDTAALTPHE